jgi:hypothetical protein
VAPAAVKNVLCSRRTYRRIRRTLRSGKPAHDNGLAPPTPIVMASAYVPISIAAVRAFQAV